MSAENPNMPFNRGRQPHEQQRFVSRVEQGQVMGVEIMDTPDPNPQVICTAIIARAEHEGRQVPHDIIIERVVRFDRGNGRSTFHTLAEPLKASFIGDTNTALDEGKALYERQNNLPRIERDQQENVDQYQINNQVESVRDRLEGEIDEQIVFGAEDTSERELEKRQDATDSVKFADDDGTITSLDEVRDTEQDDPDHGYEL